jgi:hypothetical protein
MPQTERFETGSRMSYSLKNSFTCSRNVFAC